MADSILLGTIIVLTGGILTGAFALPMKFCRRWAWENIWLMYSVFGLILLPWGVALATVPNLMQVFAAVPTATLLKTIFFGFGWGVANVLFGISVAMIGMALTFAIVGGMSAGIGSLIPLIILNPERLSTPGGRVIMMGVAITVVGVAILGIAGRGREKLLQKQGVPQPILAGLILSVLAGCFGPMLNFSYAFGKGIGEEAVRQGASAANAPHAIWCIAFIGGFAGNGGYAILQLFRNRTWGKFPQGSVNVEWVFSAVMGLMFTMGFLLYGHGADNLGVLGPVVGWPVFQATTILVSAVAGAASGEWKNAGSRFIGLTIGGMAVLVAAIVILSIGNRM